MDAIEGYVLEGRRFGRSVSSTPDGNILAIGDPWHGSSTNSYSTFDGMVSVYRNVNGNYVQVGSEILGQPSGNGHLGHSVSLSGDGNILAVGTPYGGVGGFVSIYYNNDGEWTQIGSDIASDKSGAGFGFSVSLSSNGNVVAIGAPYFNDSGNNDAGQVKIYENLGGNWTQIGNGIIGENNVRYCGWSVSLSSDGNVIAIGSPENNTEYAGIYGRVKIYKNINNEWSQIGDEILGENQYDYLGTSVSLSSDGNVVAIGAPGNDANGSSSGHARVYENINSVWTQIGGDIEGEGTEDLLGHYVSLSPDGNFIAVGAPGDNGDPSADKGYARVLKNINGEWVKICNDIIGSTSGGFAWSLSLISDGNKIVIGTQSSNVVTIYYTDQNLAQGLGILGEAAYDVSGESISLSCNGNLVAIGAPYNDGNGSLSGHVRVYEKNDSNWIQIGSDIDGEDSNDWFGRSVSMSCDGNIVAIGAQSYVKVFENISGLWSQIGTNISGEGESVSLSSNGKVLAVGSPSNSTNGNKKGSVNIYENISGVWTMIGNTIYGELLDAAFGQSVSLSDTREIMAAFGGSRVLNVNIPVNDYVKVYKNTGNNWTQIGSDITENNNGNGGSVSLSSNGNIVGIGYPGYKIPNQVYVPGKAKVYENNGDAWTQLGDEITSFGSRTGNSVFLSSDGNIFAVGASDYLRTGTVRIFENNSGNWTQIGHELDGQDSGDEFGYSVSLSSDGSIVAIGAPKNDGNGSNSGLVRTYKLDFNLNPLEGELTVFNLDSQNTEYPLQINGLSIAADGSSSTLFKYSGTNLENISLKIKENTNNQPELFGNFEAGVIVNDKLEITYNHPKYFNLPNQKNRAVIIQVINDQTSDILAEYQIAIVRPPVLMVHGLWGLYSTFKDMENTLLNEDMYDSFQMLKMIYTNDIPNSENHGTFNSYAKNLIINNRNENISLGKFDLLAHSNGGLLSRQYIQSVDYKNDVNKFITFNTPHSGSQMANLLLDSEFIDIKTILNTIKGYNSDNGLVANLKVDSKFVNELNNLTLEDKDKYGSIGVHTLSSDELTSIFVGWDYFLIKLIEYHRLNLLSISSLVFGGKDHDLIVAKESQIGGCEATSHFNFQKHVGSTTNTSFQAKTIELLNQNPNDSNYFSLNGFNPPPLTSSFGSSARSQYQKESTETISIASPISGAEYSAGQNVTIAVNGSAGIENIVTSMGSSLIPIQVNATKNSSSANVDFIIPNNAIGRLEIVSVGFDANGYADDDSTYIMVNTNAILESIEIEQDMIYVAEGKTSGITILGNYIDGEIREITNLEDLNYTFDQNNAELLESGWVKGLIEGVDVLTVSYLNKSATVPITITNASEWVEIVITTAIPDMNFEQALIDQGIDSDGIINQSIPTADIADVTSIDITSKNISDLTGIEEFTSLRALWGNSNNLTSLDLSQNTALVTLHLDNNQLTNLNLSQNTVLNYLRCNNNQLTNLDLSNNTVLETLYCTDNQLTSLDLSQNNALIRFFGYDNKLTSLNVKNGSNSLITLFDVTNNPLLTCIDVDNKNDANAGIGSYSNWIKDSTATYSEDCKSALGIDDELLAQGLSLYPNPVTNVLTIDSEIPLTKVEVYSILGKKVKVISSDFKSIPTDDISNGVYIVRMFSDNGLATKKLIKR